MKTLFLCCLVAWGVHATTVIAAAPVQAHTQAKAQVQVQVRSRPSPIDRMHDQALQSFRQARFAEAYGRFIALADVGHPASAKYALFMCEHGPTLFGNDWDCAPNEVEDWAQAAGIPAPNIGGRHYQAASKQR